MAFLSASVVLVVGALSYLLIVGKVQPIVWPEHKIAGAGEIALAE